MQTTFDPRSIRISRHAEDALRDRGFDRAALVAVLCNPESVYAAHGKYVGQIRIQGKGMSIAFDPRSQTVVTVFFNTTIDPNWKGKK